MADLTILMKRAAEGDLEARDAVFKALYSDLRRLAHARLSRAGPNTFLNTTSLVNETYLRLARTSGLQSEDRWRYLAYAGQAMRSVIVDFVRARQSDKRRRDEKNEVALNTNIIENETSSEAQILQVHEALEELAAVDERIVRVVELKYFAGLTEPEIASAMGVTERTVRRDWQKARLLLAAALS
jgi:RNA polymerase sigma factor (TIGR02999 family)